MLGEIPTGYLGDRMGRRNSLLVGTALVTLATAGMGLAGGFWGLAFVYTVWALGTTFRSGTQDAWLYDVLAEELDADAFARINGRGGAIALVVGAVGAPVGGYLAEYSLAFPFFVTAAVNCLGFSVLLTFPETAVTEEFTVLDAILIIQKN